MVDADLGDAARDAGFALLPVQRQGEQQRVLLQPALDRVLAGGAVVEQAHRAAAGGGRHAPA